MNIDKIIQGLTKLERRRRKGLRWKWMRKGMSHEVTAASQAARRKIQDKMDEEARS